MTIYKAWGFVFRFPIKIALPEMEWSATPWRKRATLKHPTGANATGCGSAELVGAERHVLWQPRHDQRRVGLARKASGHVM